MGRGWGGVGEVGGKGIEGGEIEGECWGREMKGEVAAGCGCEGLNRRGRIGVREDGDEGSGWARVDENPIPARLPTLHTAGPQ